MRKSIIIFISFILMVLPNCVNEEEKEPVCENAKRIFLTSSAYTGNLDGITGADAKCEADANKPKTGNYKAMIAASSRTACSSGNCGGGISENRNWVLKANQKYSRKDCRHIFTTNSKAIFEFGSSTSFASISDETHSVWTGLTSTWTTDTNTCADYTSTNGNGKRANSSAVGYFMISVAESACTTNNRLYCVEQ